MASFSQTSKDRLAGCDARLQKVFNEVIKYFDCTVICGHRNQADQEAAFASGKSQKHWPNGNHNSMPSKACDVAPYPIDWSDRERMTLFAGFVIGIAQGMNIDIRWGGDWNENTKVKDNDFDDLPHFEVK
jgi:peptidoglycan L-alanyl-D-glutamate endopeptidase CwlK